MKYPVEVKKVIDHLRFLNKLFSRDIFCVKGKIENESNEFNRTDSVCDMRIGFPDQLLQYVRGLNKNNKYTKFELYTMEAKILKKVI